MNPYQWSGPNAHWAGTSSAPLTADDNASFTLTGYTRINLNTGFSINNLTVTSGGGTTLELLAGSASASSIAINGTLTKGGNSNHVVFMGNGGLTLAVNVGAVTLNNGSFRFGEYRDGRSLSAFTANSVTMATSNGGNALIDFNVSSDYSLGAVSFTGTHANATRAIHLINYSEGAAYSRTATVTGINQSEGPAATIFGSKVNASSGTGSHAATLRINAAAGTNHFASTVLADGTGGTLALLKDGPGTQTLTGAHTFTGGTTVRQGTLIIGGSLAATGSLTVEAGAVFVSAAALTVGDLNLESGAVLGFDLSKSSSLTVSGDLAQTDGGAKTFVIDFRNTGEIGQTYSGLLSVGGTNSFAGTTIAFINFGEAGLSGELMFDQLSSGFTIPASTIPEPSAAGLLGGLGVLATCLIRRRRSA